MQPLSNAILQYATSARHLLNAKLERKRKASLYRDITFLAHGDGKRNLAESNEAAVTVKEQQTNGTAPAACSKHSMADEIHGAVKRYLHGSMGISYFRD